MSGDPYEHHQSVIKQFRAVVAEFGAWMGLSVRAREVTSYTELEHLRTEYSHPIEDYEEVDRWTQYPPVTRTRLESYFRYKGITTVLPDDLRYVGPTVSSTGRQNVMMLAFIRSTSFDIPEYNSVGRGIDGALFCRFEERREHESDAEDRLHLVESTILGQRNGGGVWITPPSQVDGDLAVVECLETALLYHQTFAIPTVAALSPPGLMGIHWPPKTRTLHIIPTKARYSLFAAAVLTGHAEKEGLHVAEVHPDWTYRGPIHPAGPEGNQASFRGLRLVST